MSRPRTGGMARRAVRQWPPGRPSGRGEDYRPTAPRWSDRPLTTDDDRQRPAQVGPRPAPWRLVGGHERRPRDWRSARAAPRLSTGPGAGAHWHQRRTSPRDQRSRSPLGKDHAVHAGRLAVPRLRQGLTGSWSARGRGGTGTLAAVEAASLHGVRPAAGLGLEENAPLVAIKARQAVELCPPPATDPIAASAELAAGPETGVGRFEGHEQATWRTAGGESSATGDGRRSFRRGGAFDHGPRPRRCNPSDRRTEPSSSCRVW